MSMESELDDIYDRLDSLEDKFEKIRAIIGTMYTKEVSAEALLEELYDELSR